MQQEKTENERLFSLYRELELNLDKIAIAKNEVEKSLAQSEDLLRESSQDLLYAEEVTNKLVKQSQTMKQEVIVSHEQVLARFQELLQHEKKIEHIIKCNAAIKTVVKTIKGLKEQNDENVLT
mmetsp:Transcript_13383/g.23786  ORF Transcript_13383/g.23786 Transcript_13383/m.23786 type:complete len:123 (-) Transcript_13383:1526-1894(-)|eukprot:CAMPEP_0206362076 /NCGR_PEP_ID=MMETSP0294-20121207/744_1 /ASSEMBLY_ACC=CAM_ASM_000327 /TAXON_ID=39354 /ORGANISM="Heterosigma akashiwo, Strain CCMP2393" /LENGTH=122 /DNA_ID=CAMNT_0053807087 /DNA_START=156 /DNA_END=524 /DNA_ORIENTATION=+